MLQFVFHCCWYLNISIQCSVPCAPGSMSFGSTRDQWVNSSLSGQNDRHFADSIFKCISVIERAQIAIQISLNFVPKGPIYYLSTLVQIMACCRPGDKPLTEPMFTDSLTHICSTRGRSRGGGGGTPYVMGDTYVLRFWSPFFTLAGSSTIFMGYFSHPPTAKLSFGVQKLPIFTKIDLFGPKFNFFLDLFGSNFQRPAAHSHQFSGRVKHLPPPPPLPGGRWVNYDQTYLLF